MKVFGPNRLSFSDRVAQFAQHSLHSDDTLGRMPEMNLFERALLASTLTPERTAAVVAASGLSIASVWAVFKGIFSFEKLLSFISQTKLPLASTAALALIFALVQAENQNSNTFGASSNQDNQAVQPSPCILKLYTEN